MAVDFTICRRVYLLYALSGLLSLAYQVAWFRIYVDWFGSTNLTFAMVLSNFIGGLGVGALASRSVADRLGALLKIEDRLRLYGVVELLVAASAMLIVLARLVPSDAWGSFPYELHDGIYVSTMLPQISKLAIAALCVFVPCFFMGVSFPLLCQAYSADSRFPSALYAWNTLGACSGVLLSEFVFLPWVGHERTLWIMIAVNLLLGAFFVTTGGAPRSSPAAAVARPKMKRADRSGIEMGHFGVLLLCAILSGLLSGGLEADMFKRVAFLGQKSPAAMSFISFWAILAIFLASWTVRALPTLKLVHIKVAYIASLVVYAGIWRCAYPIRSWFINRTYAPALEALSEQSYGPPPLESRFPTSLGQALLFTGILVFPAYLLISLLLPYVCNRLQSGRRHLGIAYGANTLAFCLGMVAFTWLAPRVSIFYSMKLMMVVLAVGAVLLLLVREDHPVAAWKPGLAMAVLVAGCLLIPAGFDPSYVLPGSSPAVYPVRALKSNGAHTTYVVAEPESDVLYFDNHPMSGTGRRSRVYMRLMAHFPLLAHPRPERALLICFGVGNTASAIAKHDTVEAIDVVELNDKVIETAPEFAEHNDLVYLDPRVRFIHDDGRNFLNTTDFTYDLITSEPPPPMSAGIYRLYSKEYYEQAKSRLTPEGLMTQWLPVYQMPPEAGDLVVATFVGVFPHAILFAGFETEFILVGSRSPIDIARIEQRFDEQPSVVADLRRLGIRSPLQLVARVVKGEATLSREFGGRRMISDQHNDLTYLFPQPLAPAVITFDPAAMLADIGAARLEMRESLDSVVKHLGRLRYAADFPFETLGTVSADEGPGVALAEADWSAIQSIWRVCVELDKVGRDGDPSRIRRARAQLIKLLRQALAIADEQPELLRHLASRLAAVGDHEAAIAVLQRFQSLERDDPVGYYRHGLSLIALRRYAEAIPVIQRAVELAPDDAPAQFALGRAFASIDKLDEAEAQYLRALECDPDYLQAHIQLGNVLAWSGRMDEAMISWRRAGELDPNHAGVHHNIGVALATQGQLDAASKHFREALRIDPKSAEAHNSLGVALIRAKRLGDAITHFRAAVRLDPNDAEARGNLARAQALLESARPD